MICPLNCTGVYGNRTPRVRFQLLSFAKDLFLTLVQLEEDNGKNDDDDRAYR